MHELRKEKPMTCSLLGDLENKRTKLFCVVDGVFKWLKDISDMLPLPIFFLSFNGDTRSTRTLKWEYFPLLLCRKNQYLVFRCVNAAVSRKCPGQCAARSAAASFHDSQASRIDKPGINWCAPLALWAAHCSRSWDPLFLFAFSHMHYSTAQEKAKNFLSFRNSVLK